MNDLDFTATSGFIVDLFCRINDAMKDVPKHSRPSSSPVNWLPYCYRASEPPNADPRLPAEIVRAGRDMPHLQTLEPLRATPSVSAGTPSGQLLPLAPTSL